MVNSTGTLNCTTPTPPSPPRRRPLLARRSPDLWPPTLSPDACRRRRSGGITLETLKGETRALCRRHPLPGTQPPASLWAPTPPWDRSLRPRRALARDHHAADTRPASPLFRLRARGPSLKRFARRPAHRSVCRSAIFSGRPRNARAGNSGHLRYAVALALHSTW